MKKGKTNSWLVTLGVGAGIAIVAAKYATKVKELVKDVPVVNDWLNE